MDGIHQESSFWGDYQHSGIIVGIMGVILVRILKRCQLEEVGISYGSICGDSFLWGSEGGGSLFELLDSMLKFWEDMQLGK